MFKKYCAILASCTLAILLAACGRHTHQASESWNVDLEQHWKTCAECEEVMDQGEHTLDDAGYCTTCNAQIVQWDDSTSLYLFNADGDPLKLADYDADGNVITEILYSYQYDDNGNLTHTTTLTDGTLTEENYYEVTGEGSFLAMSISYLEDGSKSVSDYDENGNVICLTDYSADGSKGTCWESQYAQDGDGLWYESSCVITEADGSRVESTFSEMRDQIGADSYDAQGNLIVSNRWEYTYTSVGTWQSRLYYCNDVLMEETIYATRSDEDGSMTYPETVTQYDEDGGKTVTIYDEYDEIVSQTRYDAEGNVIS